MATAEEQGGVLVALSEQLAAAVETAGRSIVTVDARRRLPASGIIWPEGGVVVTADHVVQRDEEIAVGLDDGRRLPATLAGRDPGSDVAVLRVAGLSAGGAELAPAASVKVGHFVLALGRPGGDLPGASFGVVSALGGAWRTARGGLVDGYIRADLTLYPGFSGGPLVDVRGRVVGLNSSHLAGGQPVAIPVATLGEIVQTLLAQGRVRRGYLGVSSQPVQLPAALRSRLGLAQETGLLIVRVEPNSPAERGGLLLGDVLLAIDGRAIGEPGDLQVALGPGSVGRAVPVSVIRGGEPKTLDVTPGERE